MWVPDWTQLVRQGAPADRDKINLAVIFTYHKALVFPQHGYVQTLVACLSESLPCAVNTVKLPLQKPTVLFIRLYLCLSQLGSYWAETKSAANLTVPGSVKDGGAQQFSTHPREGTPWRLLEIYRCWGCWPGPRNLCCSGILRWPELWQTPDYKHFLVTPQRSHPKAQQNIRVASPI